MVDLILLEQKVETSLVANRSNNAANPNSGTSYLNVNNTPSNTNPNISSQLLIVDVFNFILYKQ